MIDLVYPVGAPAPVLQRRLAPAELKASEMVPVVDASGIVLGQATRAFVHSGEKLLHPVVHLHILNRNCELYLQKRSMKKDLLPGYWDTAVGGHVGYGETVMEALYREAGEELGFYDFNPIHLTSYVFESEVERELVNVFAAVGTFELHPDRDEVADGRFWPFPDIEAHMSHSVFTPNFEQEFRRVKQTLESLL
jgi:isopentenyldiphosphate isomerase